MIIPEILLIALFMLLVMCSAFFSSSEITFARANSKRLQTAADAGDKRAAAAVYINANYTRSLSTILVGNNLVNVAASSAATMFFVELLGMKQNGELAALLTTTLILITFGETLPKIIAADRPDALSRVYARPLRLAMWVFTPIVTTVSALVKKIEPLWTPKDKSPQTTTDELRIILEDAEEQGVFTEEEGELIKGAIEFSDIMAMEILTPRVDIVAMDIDEENPRLTHDMLRHSRIPVYRDSIDNIIGILPTKLFMKASLSNDKVDIEPLLVPPVFVHKTRMISTIIREFRRNHLQMAVVLDEFGGTMGILTMEDIMEEIVGEIFDERDEVEEEFIELGDDAYQVDGGMNIYDFFDAVEYEPPKDFETEYTTMGGWTTEILDRFARPGDEFDYDRLNVKVLECRPRRVSKLRVTVRPKEEGEDE